jgi:hypothetical protein
MIGMVGLLCSVGLALRPLNRRDSYGKNGSFVM